MDQFEQAAAAPNSLPAALAWGKEQYAQAGLENLGELRVILEEILNAPLGFNGPTRLNSSQLERYQQIVKGRVEHRPLQHLLGKMWFRHLELISAPGCFIVRPETEMVVQAAIDWLYEHAVSRQLVNEPIWLADLCTGSGAIALALAQELRLVQVKAIEISEDAFKVAKENLGRYRDLANRIQLVQGDATQVQTADRKKYTLVISNPPYVPAGQVTQPEAQLDPDLALYGGGAAGLEIPKQIIETATKLLRPGGALVMEHDETQGQALRNAALAAGLVKTQTGKDLAGRDRYLLAELPA